MKPVRRARSLALRLGLTYAAGMALVVALGGFGVDYLLRTTVERGLREDLEEDCRLLRRAADDIVLRPGDVERDFILEMDGLRRPLLRITDAEDGSVLFQSRGLARLKGLRFPVPGPGDSLAPVRRTAGGRELRLASAWVETTPVLHRRFLVQFALDAGREARLLAAFRRRALLAGLAGLSLAFALGLGLARRGLRPLRSIGAAASVLDPGELRARLEPDAWPAEIAELADAFNAMLARLDERFGRLRRHSAELSHELRTPLHQVRLQLEVALGRERPGEDYRQVLAGALEQLEALSRTVDSVLFLAREADPSQRLETGSVDLAVELEELADFYGPSSQQAGVALRVEGAASVRADRDLLRRAAGNLVANALRHAPPGTEVRLRAAAEGGRARLEVSDRGPGVPAELRDRAFEPFFRAPGQPRGGGSGLGLAIVRRIAELHGGRAWLEEAEGGGCRAVLELPGEA